MVEIEKDEEECQWIAYTLSSLSPKRENIKMKKSLLKESFRKDLHWVSHFQSRKKKKKQNKKNPTSEQRRLKEKREECCWIRLFSMLFRNHSSKELKKFKKLWKFCFFVLQLHSGEQFKQNSPDQGIIEEHSAPASSSCTQSWFPHPPWLHSSMCNSYPEQWISSIHIWPEPRPCVALLKAWVAGGRPSCLHTTLASFMSHLSSQIVPHWQLWKTSALPTNGEPPSIRRIVSTAIKKITNASCYTSQNTSYSSEMARPFIYLTIIASLSARSIMEN